jgi:hypothetical protein
MENSFTDIMSKRTNEELIKVVTVDRDGYQPTAIEAAEKEIEKRNIDVRRIDELKTVFSKLADEQKQIENNKVSSLTRFLHFVIDTFVWLIVASIHNNVHKSWRWDIKVLKYFLNFVLHPWIGRGFENRHALCTHVGGKHLGQTNN